MTNKQIANEMRKHALYDDRGYIGDLPSNAAFYTARKFIPYSGWDLNHLDEINRRMFLLFIAASLE